MHTSQDLDLAELGKALGIFPTGVVAVAAEVDGRLSGLAANSNTSASLDPPLVSFPVAKASRTWPDLRRAAHLGLKVLADHHGDVCQQLATRSIAVSTISRPRQPTRTRSPSTKSWPL